MSAIVTRCSQKTGKIDTQYETCSFGLAKLWALQNTTKTKITVVTDSEDNTIYCIVKGTDRLPVVTYQSERKR